MNLRIVFFSLIVKCMSANDVDHCCNNVINIQGGCGTGPANGNDQVTTELHDEQARQLLINMSTILDEFEQRFETFLGTLNIVNISNILDKYEQRFETFLGTLDIGSKPRDCEDIQNLGHETTGVYTIYPTPCTRGFPVWCDMDTTTGGWTVIQRRISYSDFYKTWNEYQAGFGDVNENYWLGNEQIHMISAQCSYELRVDLTSMDDETAYAEYKVFSLGNAESEYKLFVDGYSGDAGDSLIPRHNGMKFSTKDRDNDIYSGNCAQMYVGGWWYDKCHTSNLNGEYGNTAYARGPVWEPWKGYYAPMKTTEMKIRRR